MKSPNVLLDLYYKLNAKPHTIWDAPPGGYVEYDTTWRGLRQRYSYAVPTPDALSLISAYAPIVEMGAGLGYWAYLLRLQGVDIIAYDLHPQTILGEGTNDFHTGQASFTEVLLGSPTDLITHPDRTLFLCWPPYDHSLAYDSLLNYQGQHLIYIGEGNGGCTGSDSFHDELSEHWEEVQYLPIPQWEGLHDHLTVYRRISLSDRPSL